MALKFSHHSPLSDRIPEDNIVDLLPADPFGMDVSGTFTAIADLFEELKLGCGSYKQDFNSGMHGSNFNDILALLPADPFGMGISNNGSFTSIHDCIKELELAELGFHSFEGLNFRASAGESSLHTGLDYFSNGTMDLTGNPGASRSHSNILPESLFCYDISDQARNEYGNFSDEYSDIATMHAMRPHEEDGSCSLALSFVLRYLGLKDLLAAGMVCKDLHYAVHSDTLLWENIHVVYPLNEKITDDVLLELTSRARGNLQCLSLVWCPRITIDVLKLILGSNPKLTKLGLSGCTSLRIEPIVNLVKACNTSGAHGIKHLRLGGLYGVTHDHFAELKSLLGVNDDGTDTHGSYKAHFYKRGRLYLPLEDDRAIDLEICPMCRNVRLVYDCPAAFCQSREGTSQSCRVCVFCKTSCACCGRCIKDDQYQETFCLELLCSTCWQHFTDPSVRNAEDCSFILPSEI